MINIKNINRYFIVILSSFILMYSCDKNNSHINDEDNIAKNASVLVNLLGVEEEDVEKLGSSSLGENVDTILSTSTIKLDDGMEALISLSEEPIEERNHNNLKLGIKDGNKIAATSPMMGNAVYVVVFYDLNDNYVTEINTTVKSSATSVQHFRWNTTYKWFAYSFNNTSPIVLNSQTNPTVSSVGNSGLLYASGQFTTSNTQANNHLSIVFKRKTAIIEVVVDGRGIFDRLTNIEMTTSTNTGLKSGTFNLKTGQYNTSSFTSHTPVFGNSDFVNFRASSADTIRKIDLYTVDTQNAINSFTVKFTNITQPTDLYSIDVGRARAFTNVEFSLPNDVSFVPKLGKKYRVVLTPIYRHLTVNNEDWAWGDLYYDGNGAKAYAFRHWNSNFYNFNTSTKSATTATVNGTTIIPHWNSYWNYKARFPGVGEAVNTIDPCTLVFPKGRWKMPNNFNSISSVVERTFSSGLPAIFGQRSPDPLRYIEVRLSENDWFPYYWKTALSFMQLGYRNSSTDNDSRSTSSTSNSNTASLYYWTSGEVGQYFYIRNPEYNGALNIERGHNITSSTNLGLRIRCVRDANFVYKTNL